MDANSRRRNRNAVPARAQPTAKKRKQKTNAEGSTTTQVTTVLTPASENQDVDNSLTTGTTVIPGIITPNVYPTESSWGAIADHFDHTGPRGSEILKSLANMVMVFPGHDDAVYKHIIDKLLEAGATAAEADDIVVLVETEVLKRASQAFTEAVLRISKRQGTLTRETLSDLHEVHHVLDESINHTIENATYPCLFSEVGDRARDRFNASRKEPDDFTKLVNDIEGGIKLRIPSMRICKPTETVIAYLKRTADDFNEAIAEAAEDGRLRCKREKLEALDHNVGVALEQGELGKLFKI